MEITKREIIVSFAIVSVMLVVGFFISGNITESQNDKNMEYNKAVKINDSQLFKYGMDTNVGNAFVYGDLQAIDTVTFYEIGGEYLHAKKIKERYERHERKVTKTDSEGKKQTKIEVYYEWEEEERESKHSEKIMFCGVEFPYKKITYSSDKHIKTINSDREYSWQSGEYVKVRFQYYGTPIKHTGTVYTKLSDGTISDNSKFLKDYTIEQALEKYTSEFGNIVFWIFWIMLMGGVVMIFYYFENNWLEDKNGV